MATTIPAWFDATFYMDQKLTQLQAVEPEAGWNQEKLAAALKDAGFEGPEGMYQHYLQYGEKENLNPNQYFDVDVYMTEKLLAMQKSDPTYTMDQLKAAFKDAGLTAAEHYEQFGSAEGLNPSNEFDQNKYMDAKLADMQKSNPEYTMEQLKADFAAAGLSPLDHFLQFGKGEGIVPQPADTPVVPEKPVNPGTTFTLTTEKDVINGTPKDDIIEGTSSSTLAKATLNPVDQINGGAGNDTLNVDMQGDFKGFDSEGFLKNVENVNLSNAASTVRTFSAKGTEGVEAYNLKGAVNLADLADTSAAVNLASRAEGKAVIGFVEGATAGKTDALKLGVENVGTAASADGKTAAKALTVEAKGIETMNVTAKGNSFVAFEDGVTSITAGGEGNLTITTTGKTVQEVNASGMTGNFDVDLKDAKGLAALNGGAGDDMFRAAVGSLKANATVDGGAGNDTLQVTGKVGTTEYILNDVETLGLVSAEGTFVGEQFNGVNTIAVSGKGNKAILAKMGATDLAFNVSGKDAAGSVSSDHQGATMVNAAGVGATGITLQFNKTATVGFDVDSDGFKLASGSTFTEAESVTVNTAGAFDASTGVNFGKAANVTVGGYGSAKLGTFDAGNQDFTLTVDGLTNPEGNNTNALDVAGITVGGKNTITINAADALGSLKSTGMKGGNLTFTGSGLEANEATFTITAKDGGVASLTGGLGADKFTVTGGDGNDTIRFVTSDKGTGTITGGKGNDTIDITDSFGVDTIKFAATAANNGLDTIKGFEVGKDGDKLDIGTNSFFGSAFGGSAKLKNVITQSSKYTAVSLTTKMVLRFDTNGKGLDDGNAVSKLFGSATGASKGYAFKQATGKFVLIDDTGDVWFIDNTTSAKVSGGECKQVGTIESLGHDGLKGLVADNFA